MLDKVTQDSKSFARLRNQVFEPDFDVVVTQPAARFAASPDHPLPVQTGHHDTRRLIPGRTFDIAQLVRRQRHVPAIANNVDD